MYVTLLRKHPDLTRLWLAQVISLLGDWFSAVTLLALVSAYTNGSGLATSGLLVARFLPSFIVSPFAGVLIDRLNRKHLLIASDVLRGVLGVVLLLFLSRDTLWLIYLVTVLQAGLAALFEPTRSAVIPNVVSAEDLLKANTLSNVTWSVMLAVGGLAGGVVSTIFGPERALVIDAISFFVSAFFIIQIRARLSEQDGSKAKVSSKPGQGGFREGLGFVRQNPSVAATLLVKFGLSLGSVDTLMVAFATTLFVVGEHGTGSLGILYSAFGIGAVLGPLLFNRFNDNSIRTMRRLLMFSFGCVTLGWFLFGAAPSLLLVSLALVVRAMGGSVTWTYSSTILQLGTPDEFRGRVFSLDWAGFYSAVTLSTLVTGLFIDALGADHIRLITLGTAFLSFIPLLGWISAMHWLDKRELVPVAAGD